MLALPREREGKKSSKRRTLLVILEQKRPILRRDGRRNRLRLDGIVHLLVIDGGHRWWWLSLNVQKIVREETKFCGAPAPFPNWVSTMVTWISSITSHLDNFLQLFIN